MDRENYAYVHIWGKKYNIFFKFSCKIALNDYLDKFRTWISLHFPEEAFNVCAKYNLQSERTFDTQVKINNPWLNFCMLFLDFRGSYYTVLLSKGFRLVSLNMNYCNNMNWWENIVLYICLDLQKRGDRNLSYNYTLWLSLVAEQFFFYFAVTFYLFNR